MSHQENAQAAATQAPEWWPPQNGDVIEDEFYTAKDPLVAIFGSDNPDDFYAFKATGTVVDGEVQFVANSDADEELVPQRENSLPLNDYVEMVENFEPEDSVISRESGFATTRLVSRGAEA